jgi:hypothetical protein
MHQGKSKIALFALFQGKEPLYLLVDPKANLDTVVKKSCPYQESNPSHSLLISHPVNLYYLDWLIVEVTCSSYIC